jgi:mannose-1-phosphate guanylyltransferase / phosphomannomutase
VEALKFSVLLIAGGRGTRSVDPSVPKSLHEIVSVPLIKHQISFLQTIGCKKVTIIGNFGFDKLSGYLESLEIPGIDVNLIAEERFGGTLGALQHGKSQVKDSHVWVILGDLFFQNHLEVIERTLDLDSLDLLIVTHPNDHPVDSDLIAFNQFNNEITDFYSKKVQTRESDSGNSAIAGIYLVNLNKLPAAQAQGDISGDLVPFALMSGWKVINFTSVEYCKDSGTPERIKAIESDYLDGITSRRSRLGKRVCFLDLDNTLMANSEVKNADSQIEIDPEIAIKIRNFNLAGVPLIVVTNQPGIAKGFFSLKEWSTFRSRVETMLSSFGAFIDDWVVCPHHPEIGHEGEKSAYKVVCGCRKPKSGMFLEMELKHSIDLRSSYMIGDSHIDRDSAMNVGVNFIHASCTTTLETMLSTQEALEKVFKRLC